MRWALGVILASGLVDLAAAQPSFAVGEYAGDHVSRSTANLTISQAGNLTEVAQHFVLTKRMCTGQIDVQLRYSLQADYLGAGSPPVDYATGDCNGEWDCNGYVVACRAIGPGPAQFSYGSRASMIVKSHFGGGAFYLRESTQRKPRRRLTIGVFDVIDRKQVEGRPRFEVRVKSLTNSPDVWSNSFMLRVP